MGTFLIKPNFNRIRSQVAFPAKSLNYFIREEIQDTFGFYQRTFGVYSYMQLNKTLQYVIHSLSGSPLLWQPHRSCSWDETGSLRVGRREFTPCKAKINEEFCYDELFDSCFEHFLTWSGRGPLELDANGINMVNQMVRTLAENAVIGARLTLTAGQLYNPSSVTFNEQTSKSMKDLFTATVGTCQGWIELVRSMAESSSQYAHMNVDGIFDEGDFSGKQYTGDPVLVFDNLRESAPADLQGLMNEGGVAGSVEGDFMPLFLVSNSIYNAIADAYRKMCVSVTCLNPRLSRREYTISTPRGSRPIYVYFIDDVPVIPITDINHYDKYLTGATHFAAITPSRNIGLGASFASLPTLEGGDVGMLIERKESAKEWGQYHFLAHALFAATIADTDYFVGTQVYAE